MITDIEQLKTLIVWAKSERVKRLEVAGVSVEFSDLAFIGEFPDVAAKTPTNVEYSAEAEPPQSQEEIEALLYHSSGS